jgi:hypothetical protein
MKTVITEKFIEELHSNVYPITIIKFLLNKKRIMNYFLNASKNNFSVSGIKYTLDHSNCPVCAEKVGMLCRQHTSIKRVLESDNVAFDLDTNVFFYKNEIFRMVEDKLVIIYCPHPKLIIGPMTDEKVRKIIPITIKDPSFKGLTHIKKINRFLSSELLGQNMRCWFNSEFHIITIPKEDREFTDFCLIPNN